jgi:hypothetical protein
MITNNAVILSNTHKKNNQFIMRVAKASSPAASALAFEKDRVKVMAPLESPL